MALCNGVISFRYPVPPQRQGHLDNPIIAEETLPPTAIGKLCERSLGRSADSRFETGSHAMPSTGREALVHEHVNSIVRKSIKYSGLGQSVEDRPVLRGETNYRDSLAGDIATNVPSEAVSPGDEGGLAKSGNVHHREG